MARDVRRHRNYHDVVTGADVLIVEDSPEIARLLEPELIAANHRVQHATTVSGALSAFDRSPPDLVVFDLTLLDEDGRDLCRRIRERSNAFVVVVSGRDDEVDKIVGFRSGADDFVTRPFSPRELTVRVEALLRRSRNLDEQVSARTVGDVVLRTSAREVQVAGQPVALTRLEFDLLETLTSEPDLVFSRKMLLDRVWGPGWYADDHVVDVHIANLRKKVDRPGNPSIVRTVRGVGYQLNRRPPEHTAPGRGGSGRGSAANGLGGRGV
jgi:DNA-binding response OmpR family regulator